MIALDTNFIVYAHHLESPFHDRANHVLAELISSGVVIGIPWPCVHEFFGIVTNPRIWKLPMDAGAAIDCLEHLALVPRLQLLAEGREHLARLRSLCAGADIRGGRIHDARIAAICLSHGVRELLSSDRDFSRFPSLRVRNPLI